MAKKAFAIYGTKTTETVYSRMDFATMVNGGNDTMSLVKGRQCDICGEWLGDRDFQWWIKIPRKASIRYGVPVAGMFRYDICNDCMAELTVEIQLRKNKKEENEKDNGEVD